MKYKYSVVIPIYNEQHNIEYVFNSVKEVMDKTKSSYELLFIDDGSSDNSLSILQKLNQGNESFNYISLNSQSGQTIALQYGFDYAQGHSIITMDGDGQTDAKHITDMIDKLQKDNLDLVYVKKIYNKEDHKFTKRMASSFANWLRKLMTKDKSADVGSNFKAYRKNFFKNRNYCSGMHRFFTGYMEIEGYKMDYIEREIGKRHSGQTKYNNWQRLKQGVGDLWYFYLYRNVSLSKSFIVLWLMSVLIWFIPFLWLKSILFFLTITVYTLLIYLFFRTLQLVIFRQNKPKNFIKDSSVVL